jgi:hypothetical protein
MLTLEGESNLKRASVEATRAVNSYRRQFGPQTATDLLHSIRKGAWMAERIRTEGPTLSAAEREHMHFFILTTLAQAEIVAANLLGDPAPVARCST